MEANATQVVADKTSYSTTEQINARIINLPSIPICDEILTFNPSADFVRAFSDLYMIPKGEAPLSLTRHIDLKGISNPNQDFPRTIQDVEGEDLQLIAGENDLRAGPFKHQIVLDHCQDGKFTFDLFKSEDEVITEPVFTVTGEAGNLPSTQQYLAKIKASEKMYEYERNLGIARILVASILASVVAYKIYQLANNPTAAVAGFFLGELSAGGLFGGFITNTFTGVLTGYTNLIKIQKDIVKDPPDLNYKMLTSISQKISPNFNLENYFNSKSIPLIIEYTQDLNNEVAITTALLHSIEKYAGSIFNDDPAWAVIHSNEIKEYSILLKQQLVKSSQTVDSLADSIKEDTLFPNDQDKINIEILRNDVRQNGWKLGEIQKMKNLGLDESHIQNVTSQFISGDLFTENQVADLLKKTTATNDSVISMLDDLIEQANKNRKDIVTNTSNIFIYDYLPVADAGGPYNGLVNQIVSFNGSDSKSPVSNIIKYEWDLNSDGKFDDSIEQNPQISYNHPFKGLVGLKVTNNDDWSDINYNYVNIRETNNAPKINDFLPFNLTQTVVLNNKILFSINATDVDNDNLSIDWQVDNTNSVLNNKVFEYTPTFNDIGVHKIQAKVSDSKISNNTAIQTWTVEVVDVDNDLDGWNANVDCEDNNPNINPGVREIHYNGIDDDCNPYTLDNNTPPTVQNVTFDTNQNQRTTIELPSIDVDDDHITFAIVDRPVNGTLGNIVVTKETNYVGRATYTPNNNFHGIDHLTFIANDGKENSSVGKVDINVGINESPIAQNQDIEINEDSIIKITLEATNPDGHPLTFSIPSFDLDKNQGKTNFGILKNLKQTGPFTAEVTYSPISDYNSDIHNTHDSFVFEVRDGLSVPGFEGREKSGATVSINVKNVNDSPNTVNQNVHTKSNTPIIIDLKGTDVENDVTVRDRFNHGLQFSIVEPPSHGTLSNINQIIQVNRSPPLLDSTRDQVTYTPQNNFVGKDSFTFITSDGLSSSSIGNITIMVQDPNTVIQRTEFEEGDIIIGTSLSGFQWYDSEGNHIKDLQSNLGSWGGTGGAFDSEGNLYVTHFDPFSLTGVSKYSKNGNFIERWHDRNDFGCLPTGTPHTGYECMSPESIVIDKQDNIFVGGVARAEGDDQGGEFLTGDHRDDIRKFTSEGVLVDSFDVKVEDRGSDWMELDPNQCTMYYTSEDKNILRYDVCDDKQLSNFANTYGVGRILDASQKINYALRILPTGEFLVASNTEIWKLDSQGSLIQKYDAPGENTWFALNVSPEGKSFWSASLGSPTIYKFDIQTGKILNYFTTHQDGITGIIIKGEPTLSNNNFAPIVFNQTGIINGIVPTLINLTGFDIANDPLTFNIVKGTNSGILSPISHIRNNISQVTYTPNSNFGTDYFTFNANDGKLNSTSIGTITMIRNHAPIANDDKGLATLQDIPINISVLTNDTDIDIGHPVLQDSIRLAKIDTSNTIGNVTINNDNTTINYVPFSPEYIGPDSFNYTIVDRYGLEDNTQVSITVLSSNNIPIAHDQSLSTMENTAKTIQLVANDADNSDQGKLVYKLIERPQNGVISSFNSTTGETVYKPLKAFHGQDSFTFRVHDGKDRSNTAYVNITVDDDRINDRPQVTSERISTNVAQQINVDVLANDVDPNGDFLTLTNFTGPFNGTAFLNPDQTITYQSDPDFNASDALYYRVADDSDAYNIGQLIIDVKGIPLTQTIEVPDSVNVVTKKNTPMDIRLLATSLIKRPLNFYIQDDPVDGTLSNFVMIADDRANVTYTPNTGFTGSDSFKYIVTDPKSGILSNIGTIDIIVEDEITNNPPVAKDKQVSLDEDNPLQIQLNATDHDTDNSINVLKFEITTQPSSGQISNFDKDTGTLTYKPNADFNGQDLFTFKAHDNGNPKLDSNVAIVSITVNPVNDLPVAVNDQITVDEDTTPAVTIPVIANDTDIDMAYEGDSLSVSSITVNPTHGSASVSSDRQSILYSPAQQYSGPDSLKYTVSDKENAVSQNQATVSIKVNPVNDPPLAKDQQVQTNKDNSLQIQLEGTDPDSGDSISSYMVVDQPTHGLISGFDTTAGTLTYTPNLGFVGEDLFTFKVVDSNNIQSSNIGTISIVVKDVVQPPPDMVPPGYTEPLSSSLCLDPSNEKTKGTQNDDNLIGTNGKETINGLGGKDRINSCGGNDAVNGNSGNDGINGDKGNDKINGNEGNDYLLAGEGKDEIHGDEGNDILKGGDGDDDLFGNDGDDILTGGTGADKFACGSGNDKITDFNQSEGDSKKGDCEVF